MKLLPQLLLNLVVVGVAIFAYDELRGDDPARTQGSSLEAGTPIDLENRIAALEAERRPTLTAQGVDPAVGSRLAALEEQLANLAGRKPVAEDGAKAGDAPARAPDLFTAGPKDPPSMDEVRRFMRLEKAARAEQQMERNRKQVEARIAKLGLSLTADQRTKLVHSYMGFQQRRNAIWSEVKASNEDGEADWPTLIRETRQRIQGEFAERVSAFMPRADADAVASSLYPAGK